MTKKRIKVILNYITAACFFVCFAGCMTISEKRLDALRETFSPLTHIIKISNDYYSQNLKWPESKEEIKKFIIEKKIDFNIEQFKVLIFNPQPDGTLLVTYEVKPYGFLEQLKFRDIIKGKIKVGRSDKQGSLKEPIKK
ncbi:MAG: hypothetical protein WCI77_03855 [Candidatus Omnitrophota bacterium]